MTRLIIEPEAEEELVVDAPLSFPVFDEADDVRCAHAVGRFPHLVAFMVVGETVGVVVHVLAFMHPRQRPGLWSHRVRR